MIMIILIALSLQVAHILDIMVPEIVENVAEYIHRSVLNLEFWSVACICVRSLVFEVNFCLFHSDDSFTVFVAAKLMREALEENLVQKRMAGILLAFKGLLGQP